MRRTVFALALAALIPLGGSVTSPAAYAGTGPTSIDLQGNGYGHGRGMSQYGAQGAATAGLSTRQIMAFYYPGTSWGTATGSVSVLISADTTSDVVVGNRNGLTLRALRSQRSWSLSRTGARRWKIVPANGGADSRLMVLTTSWRTVRTVVGPAQLGAAGAPMRLYYPGGSQTYRGVLRSAGGATRDTVNVVSLETYLRGVVPREMPATWKPAAVRAQAIAARTYAAFERREPLSSRYQICDTSRCQVYGGASAEYPDSDRAVRATAGQVLTYGGTPAFAQFSASDGGWTTASSQPGQPYLTAKADPYDHYGTWTVTLPAAKIVAAVQQWFKLDIGTFTGLDSIVRDGNGAWGGRVVSLRIVGSTASKSVSGDTFRSMMGLKSTLFAPV